MHFYLLAALALGCGHASAQPSSSRCAPTDAEAARTDVLAVLRAQADAWNAADLTGYMAGYAQTDSLRFASGGNVRQGWEEAFAAYQAGYTDAAAMGTLTFSSPNDAPAMGTPPPASPIHVTPLCDAPTAPPRWALAFGRWHLTRTGEAPEDAPHGLFTLLVERRPDGWRVVHDHTSSARKAAPDTTASQPAE